MRTSSPGVLFVLSTLLASCSEADVRKTSEPPTLPRKELLNPDTCGKCHTDHYREWSTSMHAYASKDPLFIAMNKRGQEETHGELGNFCVNCHAPMAARELGETTIDPESIPNELQGVTCYFCHDVEQVAGTHDNPLVLSNGATMRAAYPRFPKDAQATPAVQYGAHIADYSPLLDSGNIRSSNLCGACHDIVVPAHFSGADAGSGSGVALERTFQEWKESAFGPSSTPPMACGTCHMREIQSVPIASPPEAGGGMPSRTRHVHTFAAVDSAFADPDPSVRTAQQGELRRLLDNELRIQVCVDLAFGNIQLTLENNSAGHNFPSGASQDRRLWAEMEVSDGTRTYTLAKVGPTENVVDFDVPPAEHVTFPLLRDRTTKRDGSPAHMFWDVANIEDRTIPVAPLGERDFNTRVYGFPETLTKVLRPTSVKVRVWLEPVGRDVVADLIASGHITPDSAIGQMFAAGTLPRYSLLPKRVTAEVPDDAWSLEWNRTVVQADGGPDSDSGQYKCVQSTER